MKKVEELHPQVTEEAPAREAEADEEVIDIEPKEEISFEDFGKMQFQVGEIIACEKSEKIQKTALLPGENRKPGKTDRFRNPETLHTGRDGWQESDGTCKPETGKTGSVLSEGMLLCAEDAEGNLSLMTPEKAMPSGAEIC